MAWSILAGRDRMSLDNGMNLRLLSALEVLQARREAGELAQEERERALCSNACLLSRALEQSEDHTPVFPDGRAVLAALTVEEIAALAGRWNAFSRESDPGLNLGEDELEAVKKNSGMNRESGCGGGCRGSCTPGPPRGGPGSWRTGAIAGGGPTSCWMERNGWSGCVPPAGLRRWRSAAPCAGRAWGTKPKG